MFAYKCFLRSIYITASSGLEMETMSRFALRLYLGEFINLERLFEVSNVDGILYEPGANY